MRAIDADAFCDWLKEYGQEYIHGKKKISLMYIWKYVQDMPTVQPERKKGRWNCSDDMYESAVCSVCGWDTTEPWNHIRHWFNYCPKCGAKMEEGGE